MMTDDAGETTTADTVPIEPASSEPCPDCFASQRRLLMTGAVCGLAVGLAVGIFVLSRGDG